MTRSPHQGETAPYFYAYAINSTPGFPNQAIPTGDSTPITYARLNPGNFDDPMGWLVEGQVDWGDGTLSTANSVFELPPGLYQVSCWGIIEASDTGNRAVQLYFWDERSDADESIDPLWGSPNYAGGFLANSSVVPATTLLASSSPAGDRVGPAVGTLWVPTTTLYPARYSMSIYQNSGGDLDVLAYECSIRKVG